MCLSFYSWENWDLNWGRDDLNIFERIRKKIKNLSNKDFAKIKNLKKCNWVTLYIFRNLNSMNFLLLYVPRELQEILCNRVSWVGGFVKLKKKKTQSFSGMLLVKIIESITLHGVWRIIITFITLVFMVALRRIKRLPFKKVFAKTAFLSSGWVNEIVFH